MGCIHFSSPTRIASDVGGSSENREDVLVDAEYALSLDAVGAFDCRMKLGSTELPLNSEGIILGEWFD
jgi:hypothetical protein